MNVVRLAVVFSALLATAASACQICLPIPKRSAADNLLEADAVVFARENPEKPFSLLAVEVLAGQVDDLEIDLFLDSHSRRVLAGNPERKLLCVYNSDGEREGWVRIGMTDSAGLYEPVVRQVLQLAERWERNPEERPKFFSQFLGHGDAQLRQLGHLEVARAPYDQIKALGGTLPPEQIRAFLANFRYLEWHALYILLLAQSPAEGDRERIREAARSAEKFALKPQLAAWATAWIEIDEGEAVQFYTDRYMANPARDAEEVQAAIAAFSVHGRNGHRHLRDELVDGYSALLESRPAMAPLIVEDLTRWERWELVDQIREIAESEEHGGELSSRLQLRAYLKAASSAIAAEDQPSSAGQGDQGGVPGLVWILIGAGLVALPVGLALRRKLL